MGRGHRVKGGNEVVAQGIFALSLGWQERVVEQVREQSPAVPACKVCRHGAPGGQILPRPGSPPKEAHGQLKKARRDLTCALPPGFSITELQRKQAMLNASKQQATGKPKGKWGTILLLGQFQH